MPANEQREAGTLEAALDYGRRGYAVIDLDPRKKTPGREGWQKERYDQDALRARFSDGPRNISILFGEPSGGLVDVDLDSKEALALADEFLPTTGSVFGRKSKPRSHRLYATDPAPKYKKFADPGLPADDERSSLVEIRSGGQHTVVPPSTHPSGESIAWERDGEPAHVSGDDLTTKAGRLAAASLLARHWDNEGQRNDQALALLGGLLAGGWEEEEAARFVLAVARAGGDEEWRERGASAEATAEKMEAGEPITGWPRLAELVGEKVVARARDWLGMDGKKGKGEKEDKPNQAELLAELAESAYLFHTPAGEAYATIPIEDHRETYPLRAKKFKTWLRFRYFLEYGKAPNAQAVQDTLGVLEGKALFAGDEREVYVRVAGRGDAIYLDLANDKWEVLEITGEGRRLLQSEQAPVRFRRASGMLSLPYPASEGDLTGLRRLLNLPEDGKSWVLILAWLVAALRNVGPYPVLVLVGEQGTAKSTAQRVLRSVLDPNTAPLRTTPREERDLMIAANNGRIVAFDNLSGLPIWLSDALCRLSTGGGFATRQLYTDSDEIIFDATRPVMLNGISDVAGRQDLVDRSLIVEMPMIPEEKRRTEREVFAELERERPAILAGLLSAVSGALQKLPEIKLERYPRMAEFAEWMTAAEEGLGWEAGSFMAVYNENREEAVGSALEGDPVAEAVLSFMGERREWTGTAGELLGKLEASANEGTKRAKARPKTPAHLSGRLKRLAPALRAQGLLYEERREGDKKKTRTKSLSWGEGFGPSEEEIAASKRRRSKGGIFGTSDDAEESQLGGTNEPGFFGGTPG